MSWNGLPGQPPFAEAEEAHEVGATLLRPPEAEDLPQAQPQRVGIGEDVREVWAPYWGVTVGQFREFLDECRAEPGWHRCNTVYTLVEDYIKPRTRGTGLGHALLRNQQEPLEVRVMVSHAWNENAEDFLEALERSLREDEVVFVCALSLYQCEDGAGPSIAQQLGSSAMESPFRQVLEHIRLKGQEDGCRFRWRRSLRKLPALLLSIGVGMFYFPIGPQGCIPTLGGACAVGTTDAHESFWTCAFPKWHFEYIEGDDAGRVLLPLSIAFFAFALLVGVTQACWRPYGGHMIAVPNRECDLYSRLWCVYEIFVAQKLGVPVDLARTFASAGECSSREATCSSGQDKDRILHEIDAWKKTSIGRPGKTVEGHDLIDKAIRKTTRRAHRAMAWMVVTWLLPLISMRLSMMLPPSTQVLKVSWFNEHVCGGVYAVVFAGLVVLGLAFWLARCAEGVPRRRDVLVGAIGLDITALLLWSFSAISGKNSMHMPIPFHHCFYLCVLWGGVCYFMLLVFAEACPSRLWKSRSWRGRSISIVLLAVATLACVSYYGARNHQYYPTAVWYLSFRMLPLVGYPACLWMFAFGWGVRLRQWEERDRGPSAGGSSSDDHGDVSTESEEIRGSPVAP